MNNRRTLARILCFALAAVLLLGILPIAALAADNVTIYFDNTAGWSDVYIYYWSEANTSMVGWPGSKMTVVDGSIYSYSIPADATKVIFNVGSDSQKTGDLTLPSGSNLYTYSTNSWSNYNTCNHTYVNGVCSKCGESEPKDLVIYFDNTNSGWTKPYIYTWNGSTPYTGEWPGTAMTAVAGVDNLYCYTVPAGAVNIIFNNGSGGEGNQTGDMAVPNNGNNLYTKSTNSWSSYNPCAHTWDTGTVTTAPTCKVAGVKTYTCTNCGETKTESMAVVDHKYVDGVCSFCGGKQPCDHNWGAGVETTAPTCVVDGVKTYTCSKCSETKTEAIKAPGHKISGGFCSVCGAPEECVDHVWDEGVVTKENSCWTTGTKLHTCTVCGETKEAIIYAGHDIYVSSVVEPTCTKTGKQYIKCSRCAYSMDKTLPKSDHAYVAGQVVAPTCMEDGYTVHTCSDCGATANKDLVYHTGHKWSGNSCTVCSATCSHSYVDGICSKCHDGGPKYVNGYYEIANAAQLYWFAAQINAGKNTINGKLVADIDLKNGTWTSIGYYCKGGDVNETLGYSGIFDGQGHIVSNFTTAGTDNEGLFGYCSSATIMNVGVVNAKVTGWRAGAVAGYALTSTVSNCFAKDCTIIGKTSNPIALESGTVYISPVTGPQGGILNNSYAVNCTLVDSTDLDVYTHPVGGTDCQNGYYHNVTSPEAFSSVRNATEVTAAQLASGEVTYMLNKGVVDGTQAWYQTCGQGMPAHSGLTVYEVTNASGVHYTNTPTECSHSWKDATCTAPKTCSKCGATEGEALKHDYQSAVTAPTCTKEGYTTYTCSACGDNYKSDTVPATGEHNYVDGTCTGCGAAEPVKLPVLEPTGATLSLEGEVMYKVYFTVDDPSSIKSMGMLTFNSQPVNGNMENADEVISKVELVNGTYIASSNGIPAKMLSDEVYICLYAELEDGTYVYSRVIKYSGKIYADYVLDYRSDDPALQQVVVAMLNYGAEAQTFFGYKTDSLMNADLTESEKNMIVDYNSTLVPSRALPDAGKTGNFPKSDKFSYRSASMVLEGALAINYRFVPSLTPASGLTLYYWTEDTYNSVDALSLDNIDGQMNMEQDASGYYTATYDGLAAKQMGDVIYIAAVYESNGETHTTGVIAYSLYTYCNDAVTYKQPSAEIAKAAAVYGYYAEKYFFN